MKTAIDWLLLLIGAIAALSGVFMMWTGGDIIQVERGWSSFIAGAALLSGGLVTIAVVWSAIRLRESLSVAFAASPQPERFIEPQPTDAPQEADPTHVHVSVAETTAASVGTAAVAAVILSEFESPAKAEEQPAATPLEEPPLPPRKRFDPFGAFAKKRQAERDMPAPPVETPVEPPLEAMAEQEAQAEQATVREKRPTIDDLFTSARPVPTPMPPHDLDFDLGLAADELEPPTPARDPLPLGLPEAPVEPSKTEPEPETEPEVETHVEEIAAEPAPVPPKPERNEDDDWLAETARALDLELGRSTVSEPEPPPSEPAEPPHVAEQPTPEAKVIGRYTSGDTNYVMFSDGSIEAQTPDGALRFGSLLELRRFVEQRK